jgi:UDP-N-acetylmuramate: L-alanyl-gamma-D-glutamyl-meso-diaminopimelate ligase
MPQAVYDFFLKDREVIAVTGTHGKTTTTSMLAWLLQAANLQPGLLVGGVSLNFNGSYQLPGGRFFVIEGDEYDSALFDKVPKFTHYHPRYAILSSLEFDHADIYPNLKAVKKAFRKLIEILPPDGHLWVCGHYPHALEVAQPSHTPSLTYGLQPTFDLYADNLTWTDQGVNFNLFLKQRSVGRFLLPMFGEFNVLNAIAAIGVALHLDIPVTTIQSALPEFRGVRRRQEIVANIDDILIIDDFAHHPTAIQATTQSIRQRFPQRRIWGIFEPRSNTARRRHFQDQLPLAFDACDRVVLCQPYIDKSLPPDQRLDVHKVIEDIQKRTDSNKLPLVTACPHADAIASFLTAKARPKDIFVIMSNGGFDQLIPKLKAALTLRFQQSPLVFGREED